MQYTKNTKIMKVIALSSVFAFSSVLPVQAAGFQDKKNLPVSAKHRMNPYVKSCLENVTSQCALTASVQTVNAETQAMERSKVLLSVAESMITLGQIDRAKRVLTIAEEAARSTNLSIAVQVALKGMVPLHIRLEDSEKALALISELSDRNLREQLITDLIMTKAKGGASYGEIKQLVSKIDNQVKAYLTLLTVLQSQSVALNAEEIEELKAQKSLLFAGAQTFRADAIIAGLMWKNTDKVAAEAVFDELDTKLPTYSSPVAHAKLAASKLAAMSYAGMDDNALTTMLDYTNKQSLQINSVADQADYAERVGPIEVRLGKVGEAVIRVRYFSQLMDQVEYIGRLAPLHGEKSRIFTITIDSLLVEIAKLEMRYDRDVMRYLLARAALDLKDKEMMKKIISEIEDDDNQAQVLALMAGLYK